MNLQIFGVILFVLKRKKDLLCFCRNNRFLFFVCLIFYAFGSCFRTLAVILVSDLYFKTLKVGDQSVSHYLPVEWPISNNAHHVKAMECVEQKWATGAISDQIKRKR